MGGRGQTESAIPRPPMSLTPFWYTVGSLLIAVWLIPWGVFDQKLVMAWGMVNVQTSPGLLMLVVIAPILGLTVLVSTGLLRVKARGAAFLVLGFSGVTAFLLYATELHFGDRLGDLASFRDSLLCGSIGMLMIHVVLGANRLGCVNPRGISIRWVAGIAAAAGIALFLGSASRFIDETRSERGIALNIRISTDDSPSFLGIQLTAGITGMAALGCLVAALAASCWSLTPIAAKLIRGLHEHA